MVGTYPLPTPQLDRFLFKITMEHIDRDSEMNVLETYIDRRDHKLTSEFVTRQQVLCARQAIENQVHIHSAIKACLVDISRNLRGDDRVLRQLYAQSGAHVTGATGCCCSAKQKFCQRRRH